MKRRKNLFIGLGIIAVFLIAGLFINNALAVILTAIAINILFGLSFSLLFSYAGMTSLGHAVYYGMGSYFMMIYILRAGINMWAAALLSVISTTLLAVFLGAICLRTGMRAFSFLSMGIASTMSVLFNKWQFVGRDVGLLSNFLPEWLVNYQVRYYLIVIVAAVACIAIYLLTKSPFMSIAQGIRDNEERLKFLGINTNRQRLYIVIVSAFFASIAGVLYTIRSTGAYVAQLETGISTQAIMMCMVGGTETFFGPILGAILVTVFMNYISGLTIYYQGFMGAFVLITVFFIRDGLISNRTKTFFLKLIGKDVKNKPVNISGAGR